ncbi:DUF805 domain-containing protein [Clostridium botulinum]|uniref:DUF805 domain-containing protein n=1 Tax=Clostridium botulinum TaxID=1491 RepID=A0A9Q1UZ27_CLOBO|nr:DUF805 domain-containing protein [Clostridium botulinum]AEB77448.1 hypothetical protein CbC4_5027 [Clostridium botulinum BKT015925]KEH96042.1 hypothetical protein Y848_p0027 [Clostridium botulinum C/D str. Sp77]KLU74616.1 hypothetical protein CBC3_13035 [Clostridium botulinum V891]KOA74144.1 hypothetical protein ADU77_12480 [Clostridium botulinum]KOA83850.1 hypothetical protein ADU75_10015 [Clostridium botulinum]
MGIIKNYKKVISQYAKFDGRATRKEYWYFALANILIALSLYTIWVILKPNSKFLDDNPLTIVYTILTFVPSLAVSVRRLHDTNKSGWWMLLCFIPVIDLLLLLMFCGTSDVTSNKYGPIDDDNIKSKDEEIHL